MPASGSCRNHGPYEYLTLHPCVDCRETDIAVLEFDHKDRKSKLMEIGTMVGRRNWQTILIEMEKCDVRCGNCHRRRTAQQLGWFRHGLTSVSLEASRE